MQTSCGKLVSFIDDEHILITSSTNDSLEIWNCSKNILVATYAFTDDIIDDCSYRQPTVQVTLKQNRTISYFTIETDYQLQPVRILNEVFGNYDHHVLLDHRTELHYSYKHFKASLVIYNDNLGKEVIKDIDFGSPPTSLVYLSQSKSIVWLTSTSLMIFHPLYDEKIFKPFCLRSSNDPIEYDVVHDNSYASEFENQSNFLLGLNKSKRAIDVYEWRYVEEERRHEYRQLTHLQLDIAIDQCVFTAGWYDGLTLYCSDKNSIYKYNATMMTYLTATKPIVPSLTINHMPDVHLDRFLTFTDNEHYLRILTLNDRGTLSPHLSIHSIRQYHFAQNASYILLVSRKNIVSIYSLKSAKLLWTTHEFEHRKLQIHPLQSSFLLLCSRTKQLFHIDTQSFEIKALKPLSVECLLTTVTSDHLLYGLSQDQKSLVELNLNNQGLRVIPSIALGSSQIVHMYAVHDCIVFHSDDDQVYLWRRETEPVRQLESASRWIVRGTRLILVPINHRTIVLHDLKERTRRAIQLDDDAGECEALDLRASKEESEQLLFVICHDRLLRMYRISDGAQLGKLFIHQALHPFVGIINNLLLLKIANHLCLIRVLDKDTLPARALESACPLFQQSMWMICHHDHCAWLYASTA